MGQVLHGSATTTEAVRRAIQHSQESLRALAKRYGINQKTVAKWKGRTSVADLSTGPKEPRSTVLSVEEEAVVIAFPKHTMLPLDDCLYALQPTITRRWAKRGSRPSAPKDQRTASAYIFGAICPKDGKGAALVMPRCDTEAINLHLAEIATQIRVERLMPPCSSIRPAGISPPGSPSHPTSRLIPLPAKCPELNPQENVWQFMRDNWLSNRIFKSYDQILDQCCDAWNKLLDEPWKIMSIGPRNWAHGF